MDAKVRATWDEKRAKFMKANSEESTASIINRLGSSGAEKCCEMLRETEHFETRTLSHLLNNVAREVMNPARDWAWKTANEIAEKLP